MKNAIDAIYAQQASQLSFEQLYRASYNITRAGKGRNLYDGIRGALGDFLEKQLEIYIAPECVKEADQDALYTCLANDTEWGQDSSFFVLTEESLAKRAALIRSIAKLWRDHKMSMGMIKDVLMYLVKFSLLLWS